MTSVFSTRFRSLQISIREIAVTVLLTVLGLIIISNIYRSFERSMYNLEIFRVEESLLAEHRRINESLKKELELLNSEESLELLARDVLGYAHANSEVYRVKENTNYYEINKSLLRVSQDIEKPDLWKALF